MVLDGVQCKGHDWSDLGLHMFSLCIWRCQACYSNTSVDFHVYAFVGCATIEISSSLALLDVLYHTMNTL
jgi:hypothetical protein